jgi:hypothetical protein
MRQDPSLRDEQLEAEIRLVGDLVLAAAQCDDHLSDDQIDAVLGLLPPSSEAAGARWSPAAGEADTGSGSRPASGAAAPTAGDEG